MTYFVKSVGWLVTAEVVFEPKVQRMYHHLQWEKDRGLQVEFLGQCISALQLSVDQALEISLCGHGGYLTVFASRSTVQHSASTEPEPFP